MSNYNVLYSGHRAGKTTEMHRMIGKQVHDACGKYDKKKRHFIVVTPSGTFKVKITKARRPLKSRVEFRSSE